jgi:hypothetical protein
MNEPAAQMMRTSEPPHQRDGSKIRTQLTWLRQLMLQPLREIVSSVPISKSVRFCGASFTDFEIKGTLAKVIELVWLWF